MADERKFDLDDLLLRPGCYFNPQTEIMVVVDDSPTLDSEIFALEQFEGAGGRQVPPFLVGGAQLQGRTSSQ